ncbi:MAG: sigma-70 family RNA polymerase sigma factor [Eubacterium sp.]|nr:sigma-70 family RNA polymerase sigma factor [Eubacterium sp.]
MNETMALLRQAQQGDAYAKEELVKQNLGLVGSIVKRFEHRGHDREELFQIGSIGLMKAIDKFDLTYDVAFSTYAVPLISGEIRRFLRDDGLVRISRSLKENGWRVRKAAEKISQEKGREASMQELCEETGLTREDIVMAMEANMEVESIYRSVYQSDGSELYLVDQIAEGKGVGQRCGISAAGGCEVLGGASDPEKEKLLNEMLIRQLLEELEERERRLIELRYFQEKTQVQTAQELDMSQVQVSRLEKKILLKMRRKCC